MFSPQEVDHLLDGRPITERFPWKEGESQVENQIRAAVAKIERRLRLLHRIEWEHYGSGYASFVDAWFYRAEPSWRAGFVQNQLGPQEGDYHGLAVLFSRLSPYFVMLHGTKYWRDDRSGGGYLPCFGDTDQFRCEEVAKMAEPVQRILEEFGWVRLFRSELESPLPPEVEVPTILGDPPFREWDALFHWED